MTCGTTTGYQKGCRCRRCRKAATKAMQKARLRERFILAGIRGEATVVLNEDQLLRALERPVPFVAMPPRRRA